MSENTEKTSDNFYCPVYDGQISQYDCDEISCGVKLGWIPNDGLPPLMELKDIEKKSGLCKSCPRYN